jgi:hypothetical protein
MAPNRIGPKHRCPRRSLATLGHDHRHGQPQQQSLGPRRWQARCRCRAAAVRRRNCLLDAGTKIAVTIASGCWFHIGAVDGRRQLAEDPIQAGAVLQGLLAAQTHLGKTLGPGQRHSSTCRWCRRCETLGAVQPIQGFSGCIVLKIGAR